MSICAIFASGALTGTKLTACLPTLAQAQANAAAALPVLAVATTDAPISLACATTIALARSLREAVGLRPSSLIQIEGRRNTFSRRGAAMSGVQPVAIGGILTVSAIGSNGA